MSAAMGNRHLAPHRGQNQPRHDFARLLLRKEHRELTRVGRAHTLKARPGSIGRADALRPRADLAFHLIVDRDPLYTTRFESLLACASITLVRLAVIWPGRLEGVGGPGP